MESCWGVSSPNPAIMKNGKQHDLGHALPIFVMLFYWRAPWAGLLFSAEGVQLQHRAGVEGRAADPVGDVQELVGGVAAAVLGGNEVGADAAALGASILRLRPPLNNT